MKINKYAWVRYFFRRFFFHSHMSFVVTTESGVQLSLLISLFTFLAHPKGKIVYWPEALIKVVHAQSPLEVLHSPHRRANRIVVKFKLMIFSC